MWPGVVADYVRARQQENRRLRASAFSLFFFARIYGTGGNRPNSSPRGMTFLWFLLTTGGRCARRTYGLRENMCQHKDLGDGCGRLPGTENLARFTSASSPTPENK